MKRSVLAYIFQPFRARPIRSILFLIGILSSIEMAGQVNNYWTENFGKFSILLNGSVIGSVEDLGATYYNPARLRKDVESAFTINTKAYQYNSIKIKDGVGDGLDLNKSAFGGIPGLVAGQFSLKKLPRHTFAYSFLTKTNVNSSFFVRQEDVVGDILPSVAGDELFNGEITLARLVRDEWMGMSWGFKVNPVFSIGISTYLSIYDQKTNLDLTMRTLMEDGRVGLLSNSRIYNFKNYGIIWKLGMALNFDHVSLGMTATMPKWDIAGKGSFQYEDFTAGLQGADATTSDKFVANYQGGLQSNSHAPFSLGAGMGISIKENTIHISTEWFAGVKRYTPLKIEPFTGQSTGETVAYQVKDQREHVVNAGIGVDIAIVEKLTLLVSFATDFSSRAEALNIIDGVTDNEGTKFGSDFFHYGFGFSFNAKWADVSMGTVYSHSKYNIRRPVNFPDEDNDPVFDNDSLSSVLQSRWRIIVGITLPFVKKMKEKIEE